MDGTSVPRGGQWKQDTLQAVMRNARDAIVVIDSEDTIRLWNDGAAEVFGYTKPEALGESVHDLLAPEKYADRIDERFAHFAETGDGPVLGKTMEVDAKHKDGSTLPVELNLSSYEENGDRYAVAIVRDIRRRKAVERELERQRHRAETFFETAGTIMVVLDPDGTIKRINERGTNCLGYDEETLLGSDWVEVVVPDESDIGLTEIFDPLTDRPADAVEVHENQVVTADGERRIIKWHNTPLRDQSGTITGLLGSGSDITERKRREQEMRELSEEYEAIIEHAVDPIFLVDVERTGSDVEFRYERLNPAHEEMTGLSTESIRGLTPEAALGEELGAQVEAKYRQCFEAREPVTYEEELRLPEGRFIWQTSLAPVILDGEITRIIGISRDVTERVEQERELRQQNERLDEFASVISHDLRNPLTIAQGRATLLQEECQSDHLSRVLDALSRMEGVIEDTLTLARDGETIGEPELLDITDVVGKCWGMVETKTASLAVADEMTIRGDSDRLRHLFENLFRNATEHGGADVTVRVGQDGARSFYVEDDGPGIPAEKRETVFEPGQTSASGGTGFGLTIVKRIAEAHGWEVTIEEGKDGGTRFVFTGVDIES